MKSAKIPPAVKLVALRDALVDHFAPLVEKAGMSRDDLDQLPLHKLISTLEEWKSKQFTQ